MLAKLVVFKLISSGCFVKDLNSSPKVKVRGLIYYSKVASMGKLVLNRVPHTHIKPLI